MDNNLDSRDHKPWEHPYLTWKNISKFRQYSTDVWDFAVDYYHKSAGLFDCAFTCNMAQNMYNCARLTQKFGTPSTLYLHEMDKFPFSQPEWEDYEGELNDLNNYDSFKMLTKNIVPEVKTLTVPINSEEFRNASSAFAGRNQGGGDRRSLLMLLREYPRIRYEVFEAYPQFMSYFDWAKELTKHNVVYAACNPFPAYASGVPYVTMTVGGDLEIDCGRNDYYGKAMTLSFNNARFSTISNPHVLGHSRRLGFTNGIYLPYAIDSDRYSPGIGSARDEWNGLYGEGVYVLTSARIDSKVKGQSQEFITMLIQLAKSIPNLKFVFIGWGTNVQTLQDQININGMSMQMIILPPVGKKRLIDYYRSCDIVLDQFVYGYYGATALEAFSVGKPVIMKVREDQYDPLYMGDVVPVRNASTISEIRDSIIDLAINCDKRREIGDKLRKWLVRNHGQSRTIPLLLALLRITADCVDLPPDLISPLCDPLTESEVSYHTKCLVNVISE